ncbi:hypothetical protein E2C01_012176 [Portunus trituberculatus]|uniref:Uncharacterized protein n=1 Tax=Portunus trituberculatus TaxID=210409 RepID=A0A5B7DDX4_PORTR|nr:hypothetical protein [Portunus trituberculatus]
MHFRTLKNKLGHTNEEAVGRFVLAGGRRATRVSLPPYYSLYHVYFGVYFRTTSIFASRALLRHPTRQGLVKATLHSPPVPTTSSVPSTPTTFTRVTPHARQAAYMWQKLGDNPERAHDQHGALSPVNGYGAAPLDARTPAHTRPHHSHPLLSHYLRYTFCISPSCPSIPGYRRLSFGRGGRRDG